MSTLDMDLSREVVSLRQLATDKLREAILHGTFAPGQKLVEKDLWQSLGVSRTVLREALQHLQAEGLIHNIPYKGPVVATLSLKDVNDLYAVRGALEGLASAEFARHASPDQRVQLRAALEYLRTPAASDTTQSLLSAKNAFYAVLLDGCGNRMIGELLTQLNNRVTALRRVSLSSPGRLTQTLQELELVVQAIEARRPEEAQQLASAHVMHAADVIRISMGAA
ncbi:MAG: GntR family transcriptional regulator [Betaproteobacteria bacterium]|jgi:GntR family transcriptional regulator, trigonelline degradation regulator|nr:GntR family transcriptional regulator [Betaproteobacteria bacterium]NDF64548.1 GntR family transcriptional regulator [Betaproteobacteria bacterium]